MFGFRPTPKMVTADTALPGRDTPLPRPADHQVLGTPLDGPVPEGHEVAIFAMGCFWGAERFYWQLPGVWTTAVGYAGGWTNNPTYEETCTGRTGHTESVRVVYDPSVVGYEQLLKIFWEQHDPTTPNRQGNDVGTQYRSAIFTTTEAQLAIALASRDRYQAALTAAGHGTISTQIEPLAEAGDGMFHLAEDAHQQYLHKHPNGYCNHGFCQAAYDLGAHGQGAPTTVELPGG
jgi:peptide-methionine (S)-S-oxide reductase